MKAKFKSHPFNQEAVRATMDGTKTQFRVKMKEQPPDDTYKRCQLVDTTGSKKDIGKHHWVKIDSDGYTVLDGSQPYFSLGFHPGDIVGIKEAWRKNIWDNQYYYKSTDKKPFCDLKGGYWQSPVKMPRESIRIFIEITGVKAFRLQDISEEDAKAEGVLSYEDATGVRYKDYKTNAKDYGHPDHDYPTVSTAKESYQTFIEKTKGPDFWNANPWMFGFDFRVLTTKGELKW